MHEVPKPPVDFLFLFLDTTLLYLTMMAGVGVAYKLKKGNTQYEYIAKPPQLKLHVLTSSIRRQAYHARALSKP